MPDEFPSSPLYSKATSELTLQLPVTEAAALCRKAVEGDKWMHLKEGDADHLLVKFIPVPMGKNAKIEVLLADAGGAATAVTLRGWFFGMGKSQLRKAVQRLHSAIEAQTQQNGTDPSETAPGS